MRRVVIVSYVPKLTSTSYLLLRIHSNLEAASVLNGNHYLIFTKIIKNSTNFVHSVVVCTFFLLSLRARIFSSLRSLILFRDTKWLQYLFCIKSFSSKIQTKSFRIYFGFSFVFSSERFPFVSRYVHEFLFASFSSASTSQIFIPARMWIIFF